MRALYKKNSPPESAFIVTGGQVLAYFGTGDEFYFPGDNIIVGTVEHFIEQLTGERYLRQFGLSVSDSAKCKVLSFDTVDEMMKDFKFGANSNIFISRLIEYCTAKLIEKSKVPLGFLRKYQRRAGAYAQTVDLLFDIGLRTGNKLVLDFVETKKKSEFYKDGTLNIHYTPIEAIPSPAKDRSDFIKLYKQNSLLCHEGSVGRELFILLDGSINVTFKNQLVAKIATPGEAFGEMSLFLNKKRTASLVADRDSHVYVVPYSDLSDFSRQKCPDLFLKLAQGLSKRLVETIERLHRINHLLGKAETVNDHKSIQEDLYESIDKQLKVLLGEIVGLSRQVDPEISRLLAPIIKTRL
ncbi:MAG TPA: cyclic nucleotide-binding domain-containing protein [Oligoflexia bacterium]|nr:cyclic nucleotide-binding domain-containing protein [Oligoflexia bacterium]HMP47545.1 cyclic nucleotide-binding domain-containing protein [Oligoflexia bacterium]